VPSVTPGTRLGPYEILTPLGAGGMGEVYRAADSRLKRDVAIKVLPAALAQDADRLARFRREAELLAALNHPNILDAGAALMSATVSAGSDAERGTFKADVPVKLFQANVLLGWPKNSYDPSADGQPFLANVLQNGTLPPLTVVLNWHAGLK